MNKNMSIEENILVALRTEGPMTIQEIAEHLELEAPVLFVRLKRLRKRKLIVNSSRAIGGCSLTLQGHKEASALLNNKTLKGG